MLNIYISFRNSSLYHTFSINRSLRHAKEGFHLIFSRKWPRECSVSFHTSSNSSSSSFSSASRKHTGFQVCRQCCHRDNLEVISQFLWNYWQIRWFTLGSKLVETYPRTNENMLMPPGSSTSDILKEWISCTCFKHFSTDTGVCSLVCSFPKLGFGLALNSRMRSLTRT